jgi:hypothetical protein
MATIVDTASALSLTIPDTNTADTIAVSDGPAENGFQTTQVTTATDTTIFANKAAVTIDGGNKGDSVVFDNPDPAAGLQTLIVTNLGGTGTINGSNPNASSPDIAVAAESLTAGGGIGTTRALRTQASTLFGLAGTGGAGNINIANGVTAPVTLNIADLSATNAAGGAITLSNNGTINDTTLGITATGLINITASGATADLDTGSGAGITSNQSSVNLAIGRDINLGDGVGAGSVSAVTGITASAGGNITLNASAFVTNSSTGNIFLQAGGNFTMLRYPGVVMNAPEIVNNAAGGGILLMAGPGHTLTVDNTSLNGTAVQSNNGNITLMADAIDINQRVNAGSARVFLTPVTAGQAISFGMANAPGVLGLTPELNLVTAGVLQIGSNTAGNITIVSPTSVNLGSAVLSLINNGSISEKAFGSLQVVNLRVSSTGPVTLNNPNNIGVFAANTTNAVTVNDGTNGLTVGTVDGVSGIATGNGAINLTADAMLFQQQVNAGARHPGALYLNATDRPRQQ